MKIRNGFVSNSSSSSFVIAVLVQPVCPHCGRHDLNILDTFPDLNDPDCEESVLLARGLEGTLKWLHNEIDNYGDAPHGKDELESWQALKSAETECQTLSAQGYDVGVITISQHDAFLNQIFDEARANGTITVLHDEN